MLINRKQKQNDAAFKIVSKPISARPPLKASVKSDEPESQPQAQQIIPGLNKVNGKWDQHIEDARKTWNKLSHYELLKSEGEEQILISLVQKRYAIGRDEAGKQVRNFIEKLQT